MSFWTYEPLPSCVQPSEQNGTEVHLVAHERLGDRDRLSDECFADENQVALPPHLPVGAHTAYGRPRGIRGVLQARRVGSGRRPVTRSRWLQGKSLMRPLAVEALA